MSTIPVIHRPWCPSVAAELAPVGRRVAWLGVALAATAALVTSWPGVVLGVAVLLAPDLVLLLPGAWAERGRLNGWAVPLYNTTHAVAGPLALVLVGAALALGAVDTTVLGVAAAWLVHVALDRAVGYDLRTADGRVRR